MSSSRVTVAFVLERVLGQCAECFGRVGGRCKQQFVIVPRSGKPRADTRVALHDGSRRKRQGQQIQFDDGRDSRSLADVTEIGEEAVGDVDHGMRDAAQSGTEFRARLGQAETPDQVIAVLGCEMRISPTQQIEPEERIADRAGNPYEIARLGAAAADFLTCRDLADRGQRQDGGAAGTD